MVAVLSQPCCFIGGAPVQNKDGWISEAEVVNFFHPDTRPVMFSALAAEILVALDKVAAVCHAGARHVRFVRLRTVV
jgi:hypothetical protein